MCFLIIIRKKKNSPTIAEMQNKFSGILSIKCFGGEGGNVVNYFEITMSYSVLVIIFFCGKKSKYNDVM